MQKQRSECRKRHVQKELIAAQEEELAFRKGGRDHGF